MKWLYIVLLLICIIIGMGILGAQLECISDYLKIMKEKN